MIMSAIMVIKRMGRNLCRTLRIFGFTLFSPMSSPGWPSICFFNEQTRLSGSGKSFSAVRQAQQTGLFGCLAFRQI